MDIRDILTRYKEGEMEMAEAERLLRLDFIERIMDHTVFDHAREARKGIPEVIFGGAKSPAMVAEIVRAAMETKEILLVSRATPEHYQAVHNLVNSDHIRWEEKARMIVVDRRNEVERVGRVGILTAGTSDIGVAEEARIVAEAMGCEVLTTYDVGVAGLHRFLDPLVEMLRSGVDAIIVAAGMEGALPTVVSSLSDVPVIGVPVSSGYGHGGLGETALMSMLQTCSPGLAVVNIDNGVGAGAFAALISRRCNRK